MHDDTKRGVLALLLYEHFDVVLDGGTAVTGGDRAWATARPLRDQPRVKLTQVESQQDHATVVGTGCRALVAVALLQYLAQDFVAEHRVLPHCLEDLGT
jgi:hypothetical protein